MSATMFKAVVWKELRENLNWAVIVLVGMAAALAIAIPSLDGPFTGGGVGRSGISRVFEATTTIGGLLAGLLIGAAQSVLENRGDKWGFLAHRPISRTGLFWGKATAGMLLYAIATGLPVLATLAWIACSGSLPVPFDWRIALPAMANLLGGLVFYFAGFLTGMREARWYASRTLGIGAAFCCLILQQVAMEFWQAFVVGAAGLIIVGTAAWGTFVAGGHYGAQPRIGRIATAISIGMGIALVGGLVVAMTRDLFRVNTVPDEARRTSYTVTGDGVFVRITTEGNRIVEVTDPGGRPLEQYRNANRNQLRGAAGFQVATLQPEPRTIPSFRSNNRLFTELRRAHPANPVGYYYVQRLGLLAVYDSESRKLSGWMGPDGFSPGAARPRSFAGRMKIARSPDGDLQLLVFRDAVYRVELDNRSVTKIFQPEPEEALLDAAPLGASVSTRASVDEMGEFDVIATTRRVIVQRRDGTRVLETPQDPAVRDYRLLQVWRARTTGVPAFLWYQGGAAGERISQIDSAGAAVNSWTLPPTDPGAEHSPLPIAISSVIYPLIGQAAYEISGPMEAGDSLFSRPARTTDWTVAILSSLICAAAVFLRGRRYAFPPATLFVWTAVAFLLGPLGYLMLLAVIEWPARESCPACSRKRVVTRERCEHCGEPFAAPPRDGTEIFEPVPYQQA